MKIDRPRLIRFLRQHAELGGGELMLDSLTAAELIEWLQNRPQTRAAAGVAPVQEPTVDPSLVTGREEAAPDAHELTVLAAEAAGCTSCRLSEGRRNVVFGTGNPAAEVVVIGEAPGAEEDRTGEPFVGRAGKLLDLLLLSAGLPREQVYICNVLKCRPPNNRDPEPDEVTACSSFLHRQLTLIEPRVLLAVGKFAAQLLAASQESIGSLRGRVHTYRDIPLVATYHPSYLLRSPTWMRAAWQDFQLVREVLEA